MGQFFASVCVCLLYAVFLLYTGKACINYMKIIVFVVPSQSSQTQQPWEIQLQKKHEVSVVILQQVQDMGRATHLVHPCNL